MSDRNDLLEMMSESSVMRFTGFKEPQSHEKVEMLLKKWITEGSEPLGAWAAEDIQVRQFLGWFMLKKTICDDPELGFMLPSSKWGKGYATEVAGGLLDYAFYRPHTKFRTVSSFSWASLFGCLLKRKISKFQINFFSNLIGI